MPKRMPNMKTLTTASSPLAALFQFPFGCLCKCGVTSPTVLEWIEFKYLDLWGKAHSLSFKFWLDRYLELGQGKQGQWRERL